MNTLQHVFDAVATHLLNQPGPAMSSTGTCRYRAPDGRMCAVGCLVPDDRYDPGIEGYTVLENQSVWDALPIEIRMISRVCSLLSDLQSIHDNHDNHILDDDQYIWNRQLLIADLADVARAHNLSPDAIA